MYDWSKLFELLVLRIISQYNVNYYLTYRILYSLFFFFLNWLRKSLIPLRLKQMRFYCIIFKVNKFKNIFSIFRRSVLYSRNQLTKPNPPKKSSCVSSIWSIVSPTVCTSTQLVVSSRKTKSFSWHRPHSRSYSWRKRLIRRS